MKSRPVRHSVPLRLPLADQAAECLRAGVHSGRWKGTLPPEGVLCRELGISRGTLRSALGRLFEESILRPGGRGGRHAVAAKTRGPKRALPALNNDIVRLISPQPRFIITELTQLVFQAMSESLGRAGLHLEFEYHAGLWKLQRPDSALRKITQQPRTAGCALYRSTQAVQQWFARSTIPSVVLGGIFPGIALPHAEFDLVAASRHAAGVFAARGHRRIVFLSVEKATAGDNSSAAAFVAAAAAAGAHGEIAIYDDTVPGLCHVLDGLLLARPVPTAYLVAFPSHVHATIGHLTRRGFPVPKSAAVISRLDARLLAESIPTVARYQMDGERLGRNSARLIRSSLNPAGRTKGHCILMPEFIDGETAGGRSA